MQGQRNPIGSLPENLFFDDGSFSGDSVVSTRMPSNNDNNSNDNLVTYGHNRPRYMLPSNHNNMHFLQHSGLYDPNVGWISGESSSNTSQHQVNIGVRNPEDTWNFSSSGVCSFANQPSSSTLSLDNNAGLSSNSNPTPTLMGKPFPRNVNMSLVFESNDDCSSLENRCKSRKRKSLDPNIGQTSDNGVETSQWPAQIASSNTNSSLQTENDDIIAIGNASGPAISSHGRAISSSTFSLTASANAETSRRNFRLRANGSTHQGPQLSRYSDVRNVDDLLSHHSSRSIQNCFLGWNPAPEVETVNHLHMQPAASRLPNMHRNLSLASSRRLGSSPSSSSYPVSDERVPHASGNIQERSMFLSSTEIENASQNPAYLNLINRNLASTSRASTSTHTHRPRRLSEMIRRPLMASLGIEPGGLNGARSGPYWLEGLGHRVSPSRSATADGGRSSSISEHVRRILDTMRRGEGLGFEDMMILDHPAFFAMADMHDRHRDMRMDVDNMSYEELLALEERIGNVCTGLSEESIMKHMKQQKYANDNARDQSEIESEPCSICREEYNEGDDVGKLECGHDFHTDCIKEWLKNKNLCPICRIELQD